MCFSLLRCSFIEIGYLIARILCDTLLVIHHLFDLSHVISSHATSSQAFAVITERGSFSYLMVRRRMAIFCQVVVNTD